MSGPGVFGMSWPAILLLVLLVVTVLIVILRARASKTRKHLEAAERLARAADADHEGARTRHEGGA